MHKNVLSFVDLMKLINFMIMFSKKLPGKVCSMSIFPGYTVLGLWCYSLAPGPISPGPDRDNIFSRFGTLALLWLEQTMSGETVLYGWLAFYGFSTPTKTFFAIICITKTLIKSLFKVFIKSVWSGGEGAWRVI